MSREFAKHEIIIYKCNVCGARNKLFKKIDHKLFTITCCNCGHFETFKNDPSMTIPGLNDLDKLLNNKNEVCIRLTTCNNKKCRYYNSDSSNKHKSKSKCNNKCCEECGQCCYTTYCIDDRINEIMNRNSDDYQLVINETHTSEPKFH